MRKTDYELIAKTLRNYNYLVPATTPAIDVIEGICKDLAIRFTDDNPKFDRTKFLSLCGVETVEQHITKLNKSFKFGDS